MTRHEFDAAAFVWGIVFLCAAALSLAHEYAGLEVDVKWLLPAALVVAGLTGIANALRPPRR